MGSVFSLILGMGLGVLADRLCQRVERRPRFKITSALHEGYSPDMTGILFEITNVGSNEVPDYEIVLFHPRRGRLIGTFACQQSGPQIPKEIREHLCVLLKQGAWCGSRWYFQENEEPVEQVTFEGFRFRLVMKNSERILFESERIGNTLAKVIVRTRETGRLGFAWEEALAMQTPPRWRERAARFLHSQWRPARGVGADGEQSG